MSEGFTIWRYRRRFEVDGVAAMVVIRARSNGLASELLLDGELAARDHTPMGGPDSVRNHRLSAHQPDGSLIEVVAGYISTMNTGIAVHRDGVPIHESHPGRIIAYPEKYREAAVGMGGETVGEAMRNAMKETEQDGLDFGKLKRNRIPLMVDIALGLMFFVVAKLTDLTTAALVGAGVGIALLLVQRLTKIDLLGGLALFGIVLLLMSAGLAFLFQSDEAVKYRTTVIGLISAALFFADGVSGGKRLATRLMQYLPYSDLDPARLGIGMGLMGLVMAGANQAVAMWTSTDVWLVYSTFADFIVAMGLMLLVFRYARGEILVDMAPRYRRPPSDTPAPKTAA